VVCNDIYFLRTPPMTYIFSIVAILTESVPIEGMYSHILKVHPNDNFRIGEVYVHLTYFRGKFGLSLVVSSHLRSRSPC
jgi:hypothetical protein